MTTMADGWQQNTDDRPPALRRRIRWTVGILVALVLAIVVIYFVLMSR